MGTVMGLDVISVNVWRVIQLRTFLQLHLTHAPNAPNFIDYFFLHHLRHIELDVERQANFSVLLHDRTR